MNLSDIMKSIREDEREEEVNQSVIANLRISTEKSKVKLKAAKATAGIETTATVLDRLAESLEKGDALKARDNIDNDAIDAIIMEDLPSRYKKVFKSQVRPTHQPRKKGTK